MCQKFGFGASPASPRTTRRQTTPPEARTSPAGSAEEITVTEFCRDAILQASEPPAPELEGPPIPSWLVALFLLPHRGRTEKPA